MSNSEQIDKKLYDELLLENEKLKKRYDKLDKKYNSISDMDDSTAKTFFNSHIELKRAQKRFNAILEQSDKQSKKLLTDIEKKEQMLIRNKLTHISDMISMLAHQWRQPLAVVSSLVIGIDLKVDMNTYNFDDENERKEFLKFLSTQNHSILDNINKISTTIDDFTTFFKPSGEKELVLASLPINNALSVIKFLFDSTNIKTTLDFQYQDEVLLSVSDIMDVILNILNNCEENFKVKKTINPHIGLSTQKKDNQLIIIISDNGGGIPKENLDKVFDPYFSTKSEKNGTGMGLHINKTIIEEHYHGKFSVYNGNNGAIFEIALPIS